MIRPFGEQALLLELDSVPKAQAFGRDLLRDRPAGVSAVVPGLASVMVELDPTIPAAATRGRLEARLDTIEDAPPAGRARTIPVVYGGAAGPDLDACAAAAGISAAAFAERHAALELRVLFCGFAAGFAYLGDLPDELQVARLETPRTHTPPGSVAIAGPMTGIYPRDLPGGWRVIGRTAVELFDPRRDPPAYLVPGDVVRFESASSDDSAPAARAADDW